jgi:serine protease Do
MTTDLNNNQFPEENDHQEDLNNNQFSDENDLQQDLNNANANSYSSASEQSVSQTTAYYRPYKKGIGTKGVVGIILSCAILFSAIGFGSGMLWRSNLSGEAAESSQTLEEASTSDSDDQIKTDLALKTASSSDSALTIAEIADKDADSVVEITTESVVTGSMLQQYISSGAGSGVIITEDGYILTNNHVIEDATSITVTTHSGESYSASIVGLDDQLDVALLKIDATGLKPATIGSSADLVVGETVVAIGNPLGQLGGTVTDGIISALDRSITLDGQTMTLLQTNAAINPGNSGGGLFNEQGNLIGLVVAKSSGDDVEGLGFAIPIDKVVAIIDDLKEYGYVTGRVSIGVSLLDIDSDQMAWMYRVSEQGTYVYSVTEGSAAEEGGLQSGDRIISVMGTEISSANDVKETISGVSVGDAMEFVVMRDGEEVTLTVYAGEYVPDAIQEKFSGNGSGSTTTSYSNSSETNSALTNIN